MEVVGHVDVAAPVLDGLEGHLDLLEVVLVGRRVKGGRPAEDLDGLCTVISVLNLAAFQTHCDLFKFAISCVECERKFMGFSR